MQCIFIQKLSHFNFIFMGNVNYIIFKIIRSDKHRSLVNFRILDILKIAKNDYIDRVITIITD